MLNSEIEPSEFLGFLETNKEKIISRFALDKNFDKDEVFKVLSEGFLKTFEENSQDIQLYLSREDQLIGVNLLKESKWDSDHFNLKIGKTKLLCFSSDAGLSERVVLLEKLVKESSEKSYDLLFVRVPMSDMLSIIALEKQGAMLTDVLMTFYRDLKDLPHSNIKIDGVEVEEASKEEDVLVEIARKLFEYDHFHADPFLSTQLCDELYAKWVRNSLCGLADKVLVARKNQRIVGFITCKIESLSKKCKSGFIDLIGVEREDRGKGIGSLLVSEALSWFCGMVPSVYVGTQVRNTSAAWLYIKLGFKPVYSEATMHLWISR